MSTGVGVAVVVGNCVAFTRASVDVFAGTEDVVSDADAGGVVVVVVIAGARAVADAGVVMVRSVGSATALITSACKSSFFLKT